MKRFKKSFALFLTAVMLVTMAVPALANGKTNENLKAHWAGESVEKWKGNGVIQGYPDGSFKPDHKVTRAELVSIINKLFEFSTLSEMSFSVIPAKAWYASALSIAKQAGYYKGFPDNKAKADTEVTRQDAATLIASVFSLEPTKASQPDVQAKLFLQLGGYAVWVDSGAKIAAQDGFTELTIDLSNNSNLSPENLKKVDAIGIQFVTPSTAGTATAYIDEIIASN